MSNVLKIVVSVPDSVPAHPCRKGSFSHQLEGGPSDLERPFLTHTVNDDYDNYVPIESESCVNRSADYFTINP